MRLRRLDISGIGPFRGQESIDFDALTRSGLFLIEGPTGAGKSTIIDAITYALYGSVAGGRESTTDRIRSDLADSTTPSYVELEFDVAGRTYVIRRQPAYSRPKLRGEGMIKENAKQSLRAADGSMEPLTDAREIAMAVQRLLGLSVEHFRKLVVLPQGEFDALLRASPADRFEVLGRLIDDGFMERVQEDLVARGRAAEALRSEIQARVQEIASTLCSRATEALDEVPPAADLDSDQIADLLAALDVRVHEAQLAVEALTGPAHDAAEAATIAESTVSRAREGAAALEALERTRTALPQEWRAAPADQLRQRRSEVAALIGRLEPYVTWEAEASERRAHSEALATAAQQAREQVESLSMQAQALPEQRTECDRLRQAAVASAATLPQATAEVERLDSLITTAESLRRGEADLAKAAETAAKADGEAERCREALLRAREQRVALLERRLAHSAADLAARLRDGDPCPVCGSLDHPDVASTEAGALVTDAEVEDAESAVRLAEEQEAMATSVAASARNALRDVQSAIDGLRGRLADVDITGLEGALSDATGAVTQAKAAADTASALTTRLAEIDAQIAALNDATAAAATARAQAEARLAADTERTERETAALLAVVGEGTTATAAIEAARKEATAIDSALEAFEKAAAHVVDGQLSEREAAAVAARAASHDLRARLELATQAQARITATRDAVAALADEWAAAHADIADVLRATDTAVTLGQLVSAQSKANTRRLTLQSYAVQRRFRNVLDAATVHLERMSGSHFAFELDESAGRGQSGLGIAVRDQWSGAVRDPKALSGGETFIASLALALGLADVVREENGGVDLQTLFVDEGFGSLDQESLQQVLDQLDALRTRGRVVGVISHVTEMKDWVHDRVVVVPGTPGQGSTLLQPR